MTGGGRRMTGTAGRDNPGRVSGGPGAARLPY